MPFAVLSDDALLTPLDGSTDGGSAWLSVPSVSANSSELGQLVLQETVGQVVLPFFMTVMPQLLPEPLGVATRVWASG